VYHHCDDLLVSEVDTASGILSRSLSRRSKGPFSNYKTNFQNMIRELMDDLDKVQNPFSDQSLLQFISSNLQMNRIALSKASEYLTNILQQQKMLSPQYYDYTLSRLNSTLGQKIFDNIHGSLSYKKQDKKVPKRAPGKFKGLFSQVVNTLIPTRFKNTHKSREPNKWEDYFFKPHEISELLVILNANTIMKLRNAIELAPELQDSETQVYLLDSLHDAMSALVDAPLNYYDITESSYSSFVERLRNQILSNPNMTLPPTLLTPEQEAKLTGYAGHLILPEKLEIVRALVRDIEMKVDYFFTNKESLSSELKSGELSKWSSPLEVLSGQKISTRYYPLSLFYSEGIFEEADFLQLAFLPVDIQGAPLTPLNNFDNSKDKSAIRFRMHDQDHSRKALTGFVINKQLNANLKIHVPNISDRRLRIAPWAYYKLKNQFLRILISEIEKSTDPKTSSALKRQLFDEIHEKNWGATAVFSFRSETKIRDPEALAFHQSFTDSLRRTYSIFSDFYGVPSPAAGEFEDFLMAILIKFADIEENPQSF
jgi:hypothetical protein